MLESREWREIYPECGIWINEALHLGSGQYGSVYRGYDRSGERDVAVKEIKVKAWNQVEEQEYIDREYNLTKQIDHPNIIKMFSKFKHSNREYIVMEYGGITLTKFMKDYGKCSPQRPGLPEQTVLSIFRQLVSGLYELQCKGILHRDIKPDNILINEDTEEVKIVDFGLANFADMARTMLGTPLYMAPELVVERKNTDSSRCDVWSLGLVLYEMLTGEPFFQEMAERNDYNYFVSYMKQEHDFMDPPFPHFLEPQWTKLRQMMIVYKPEHRSLPHQIKVYLQEEKLQLKLHKKYASHLNLSTRSQKLMSTLHHSLSKGIPAPMITVKTLDDGQIVEKFQYFLKHERKKHLFLLKILEYLKKTKYYFLSRVNKYLLCIFVFQYFIAFANQRIKTLEDGTLRVQKIPAELNTYHRNQLGHMFHPYENFYEMQKKEAEKELLKHLLPKLQQSQEGIQILSTLQQDCSKQYYLQKIVNLTDKQIRVSFQRLEQFYPVTDLKVYLIIMIANKFEDFLSFPQTRQSSVFIDKLQENLINWHTKKDREEILILIRSYQ